METESVREKEGILVSQNDGDWSNRWLCSNDSYGSLAMSSWAYFCLLLSLSLSPNFASLFLGLLIKLLPYFSSTDPLSF